MYPSRPRTDGDVISSAPRVAHSLYPGLSHYAPLGRTIRLRIGVDCTLQAIQVVEKNRGLSPSLCKQPRRLRAVVFLTGLTVVTVLTGLTADRMNTVNEVNEVNNLRRQSSPKPKATFSWGLGSHRSAPG